MNKVAEIIRRKPPLFLLLSLGFLVLVGVVKWRISPPLAAMWYVAGGLVGVYFLDAAEVFFALDPSPFRSHVFAGAFAVLALFVLTSSGSLLAQGLVLSIAVTLVLRRQNLVYLGILAVETLLFIAWA